MMPNIDNAYKGVAGKSADLPMKRPEKHDA